MANTVCFEIGSQGAHDSAERGDLCIIVDVLRASTSIIAAFMGGFSTVCLGNNAEIDSVNSSAITAGERDGVRIAQFTFGNSPPALVDSSYKGQELLFFSTNGIPAIIRCTSYKVPILIGALINVSAVGVLARKIAHSLGINISIILAGYHGILEEDDLIAGSVIYQKELHHLAFTGTTQPKRYTDVSQSLINSASGKRLALLHARSDVLYCAQQDITSLVPIYNPRINKIIATEPDSNLWESILC